MCMRPTAMARQVAAITSKSTPRSHVPSRVFGTPCQQCRTRKTSGLRKQLFLRAVTEEAARAPASRSTQQPQALEPLANDPVPVNSGRGLLSTADFTESHEDVCDLGLPDMLCSTLSTASPPTSIFREAFNRGKWLLGLLVLQSASSIVLDRYEVLLREHLFVTLFLTMLVGAGGNAGNQSAIKVIRGLATGVLQPNFSSMMQSIRQQSLVALLLGGGLSVGGFLRVWLSTHDVVSATAITASLFIIVVVSIIVGTLLPYAFAGLKVDPAHGGTTIQVFMDVTGVAISCATCTFVLDQLANGLSVAAM